MCGLRNGCKMREVVLVHSTERPHDRNKHFSWVYSCFRRDSSQFHSAPIADGTLEKTRFATVVICVISWTFSPLGCPIWIAASGIDHVQEVLIFPYVEALPCSEDEPDLSSICFLERLNAPNMLQTFSLSLQSAQLWPYGSWLLCASR